MATTKLLLKHDYNTNTSKVKNDEKLKSNRPPYCCDVMYVYVRVSVLDFQLGCAIAALFCVGG